MQNEKQRFTVEQKAVIWYRTHIEADTAEDALKIAGEDVGNLDWWQNLDGVEFLDSYWIENESTGETKLIEND